MNQFKTIRSKAPWYFISNVLKGLSGFLLLPIYTRYLSPDQYGQFQTLRSLAEFLPLIISLSLHSAFARLYFDYKDKDFEKLSSLFSSIYWFLIGWGAIVYLVSVVASQFFVDKFVQLPVVPFIVLAFLAPLLNQISVLGDSLLKLKLESRLFSIISTLSFFISSALNVVLLISTDLKVEACLIGYIVINLIPFLFYTYMAFKQRILRLSFQVQMLIDALKFSLPFHVAAVASWLIGYSDKLILSYYGSAALVGNYAISVTISKIMYMLNDSISQIHGPLALDDFAKNPEKASDNMTSFLQSFMALLTMAFLGLSLFSTDMVNLFLPRSYTGTTALIPILAASYVVSGLYRPYVTLLGHYKHNWAISHATIIMAVCGVIFNFAFIPIWKDKAAAISQLVSVIIFTAIIIFHTQKKNKLNVNFITLLAPLVLAFISALLLTDLPTTWTSVGLKTLVILLFASFYVYEFKIKIFKWNI